MKEGFIWYCLQNRPIKVIVNLFGYTKSTKKYLWFRDLVFFSKKCRGFKTLTKRVRVTSPGNKSMPFFKKGLWGWYVASFLNPEGGLRWWFHPHVIEMFFLGKSSSQGLWIFGSKTYAISDDAWGTCRIGWKTPQKNRSKNINQSGLLILCGRYECVGWKFFAPFFFAWGFVRASP